MTPPAGACTSSSVFLFYSVHTTMEFLLTHRGIRVASLNTHTVHLTVCVGILFPFMRYPNEYLHASRLEPGCWVLIASILSTDHNTLISLETLVQAPQMYMYTLLLCSTLTIVACLYLIISYTQRDSSLTSSSLVARAV